MIIYLGEGHKKHLEILNELATSVLIDYCKLSWDFLQNGPNNKKYCIAAQKLQVDESTVENAVAALAFLLVETCKHNLSENDFKMTTSVAGFSPENQDILLKLYMSKKSDVSEGLHKLQDTNSWYQDFKWRFEVQIASKSSEDIKPKMMMDLILKASKSLNSEEELVEKASDIELASNSSETSTTSNTIVSRSIADAKTTSECENVIQHVFLDCDIPNLLNLTSKLDQALLESKSHHVRKIQRTLQRK